ncbi:hypothetical protein [Amaricoccus sp.]|uniref:hypothetical protein n=1 Tax=Amaricoccus sp. TaxID=1872485 RepID=UPI001B4FDFBA|nr:hypothetical protein [Amaricoccus sp.]MBP7242559.1 hypothetical protein [Amaricoccus sp.]
MRRLIALFALVPAPVLAEAFERPIPQGETGVAAVSYAVAALALIVTLGTAQWLVRRR